VSTVPWGAAADDLLADGEWHDGRAVIRAMDTKIPPGVASRQAEENRERAQRVRGGQAGDRREPRTTAVLIVFGKRSITRATINGRIRSGAWEVRPWPLPRRGWRSQSWEVRDIRQGRVTVSRLARQYGLAVTMARGLVMQEPALSHTMAGRVMYVSDTAAFAERLTEYRSGTVEQQCAARTGYAANLRRERIDSGGELVALTHLARRCGIAPRTAQKVREANPDLPWVMRGRWTLLPVADLPRWEEAVNAWHATVGERRTAAATLYWQSRKVTEERHERQGAG
jgi:hypothetical protein